MVLVVNKLELELVLEEKMATLPLGFPSGTVVLKDDIYNLCHDLGATSSLLRGVLWAGGRRAHKSCLLRRSAGGLSKPSQSQGICVRHPHGRDTANFAVLWGPWSRSRGVLAWPEPCARGGSRAKTFGRAGWRRNSSWGKTRGFLSATAGLGT